MAYRETGARFSVDRRYRYALRRVWDRSRGVCNFLLLNPSIADEVTNDPTSVRCERRARRWGFGGLIVTNLFALCATDPAGLRRVADPTGPENDAAILETGRGLQPSLSVAATCRQQGRNVLEYLTVCFQARLAGDPLPFLMTQHAVIIQI